MESSEGMEVDGWDPSLEEELGISLDELKKWIEEAVEKSEIVQKKKAQLTELKEWVEQKEEEEAKTEMLLSDANQSILECEKLVKATYHRNGLVYRESSSEDEGCGGGVLSSEVIEIDDDDDDDEDDMFGQDIDLFDEKFQTVPTDPVEAEKLELMKMRTLERRAKMSELQRLRNAQSIQRRLEEIEVTFKDLEDKGVELERTLRGEAGSSGSPDMIEHWIQLVHEKNALVSEESDLMVASRQLELEDKQSMLELELRKYMELNDKTPEQQAEEDRVLQQMIEVVDMRDSLVAFLEEKRLKEISEEQEAFSIREAKRHSKAGAQVHWA